MQSGGKFAALDSGELGECSRERQREDSLEDGPDVRSLCPTIVEARHNRKSTANVNLIDG